MSVTTMILGQSGTGKSTSLRNMKAENTLLIQTIQKPLPFKNDWKSVEQGGNVYVSTVASNICNAMIKTKRDVIVLDDMQYLLAFEFMNRAHEKGYEKFTEMARHYFDVLNTAINLPDNKRVYLLSHTDVSEQGQVKAKTIGKLLDEKITVEGMVSIVLRTHVINGQYVFSTKNSGSESVKSPLGLFDNEHIDNDLEVIDSAIKEYYNI